MEKFKEDFRMVLDGFMRMPQRNAWLEAGPMQMYVRKSTRLVDGMKASVFDVASIQVETESQGMGYFSAALDIVMEEAKDNMYDAVMVESIVNERLAEHFAKKPGWEPYNVGGDMNINYIYRYA